MPTSTCSPSSNLATLLLVSPADDRGFEELLARVRQLDGCRSAAVEYVTPTEFLERLRGAAPELLVVCQSWPDEFPAAVVESLLMRWPLTRVICCYGAWCASDGRTRSQWPIGLRVPADQAIGRLNGELQVLRGRRRPLPVTATRDEAFDRDYLSETETTPDLQPATEQLGVAIVTHDDAHQELLAEACRRHGFAIVPFAEASSERALLDPAKTRIILWDADSSPQPPADASDCRLPGLVETLRRQHPNAVLVAIVGDSRAELRQRWFDRGVSAVHPRLSPLSQLIVTLRGLATSRYTSTGQ